MFNARCVLLLVGFIPARCIQTTQLRATDSVRISNIVFVLVGCISSFLPLQMYHAMIGDVFDASGGKSLVELCEWLLRYKTDVSGCFMLPDIAEHGDDPTFSSDLYVSAGHLCSVIESYDRVEL